MNWIKDLICSKTEAEESLSLKYDSQFMYLVLLSSIRFANKFGEVFTDIATKDVVRRVTTKVMARGAIGSLQIAVSPARTGCVIKVHAWSYETIMSAFYAKKPAARIIDALVAQIPCEEFLDKLASYWKPGADMDSCFDQALQL